MHRGIFALVIFLGNVSLGYAELVAKSDCFPIENLAVHLRTKAEVILRKALHSEALYSLATDLKPISSDFFSIELKEDKPSSEVLQELQSIMSVLHCGKTIRFELHKYAETYEGSNVYSAVAVNLVKFKRLMEDHPDFFSSLGDVRDLDGEFDVKKVIDAVESSPHLIRLRGYGYLHGYPDAAVNFFVSAARREQKTKRHINRSFVSAPTYDADDHHFVWAVPKGMKLSTEEFEIISHAKDILRQYRELMSQPSIRSSPVKLIRKWFSSTKSLCDTEKPKRNILPIGPQACELAFRKNPTES